MKNKLTHPVGELCIDSFGRVQAYNNTQMPLKLVTGTLAMELASGAAETVKFIADAEKHHIDQSCKTKSRLIRACEKKSRQE